MTDDHDDPYAYGLADPAVREAALREHQQHLARVRLQLLELQTRLEATIHELADATAFMDDDDVH